jgi:putative oxidoreductase
MMRLIDAGHAPRSVILIRWLVGAVFLAEGIQKFLFPAALGVGRFAKIGLPAPSSWRLLSAWSKSPVARC